MENGSVKDDRFIYYKAIFHFHGYGGKGTSNEQHQLLKSVRFPHNTCAKKTRGKAETSGKKGCQILFDVRIGHVLIHPKLNGTLPTDP